MLVLVPPVPVGKLGSSLTPDGTIYWSVFSLFPVMLALVRSSWNVSMFSSDVLFFACHHLESMTLQHRESMAWVLARMPCSIIRVYINISRRSKSNQHSTHSNHEYTQQDDLKRPKVSHFLRQRWEYVLLVYLFVRA